MLSLFKPEIKMFCENYSNSISSKVLSLIKNGKSRIIFNGPAGTGKNFLAEALANSINASFEVINLYEFSDDSQSVSSAILNNIKSSAVSKSLFQSNRKIIYIEDIEKILSVKSFYNTEYNFSCGRFNNNIRIREWRNLQK